KFTLPDKKRQKDFYVGIIARITPIKGHLHFIKAMAKVYREVPQLKIFIVGDAPRSKEIYKDQVRVLTKRLGLWHCTEFLGVQRDVPAILEQLDVLVLATTTQEAFGRVIIEAQAAGVPVVATKVGGVIDIIEEDKTGLLVPPADPQSMASAVVRILKNKELARNLAENAYKKVKEKYTIDLMVKKTVDVYQEAKENFKILIIKFSSLGDIILSTAALKAIKEKFGQSHKITFLVSKEYRDVLLNCPYIDELLVCDFKNKEKGLRGLYRLGSFLRKKNFDMIIDLQNNRRSHILSFLTLAMERYGYNNKKFGFLLNKSVKDDRVFLNPLEHQFRILKLLGIELSDPKLELWPRKEDRQYVNELLKSEWISSSQKIVGINISASQRWMTKNWPLDYVARLCEDLASRDIRLVITGTQNDIRRAEELMNLTKKVKPINACGKTTVNQLACLIKKCSVYITADSAPLHIAVSQDVPLVALFGPTDPLRHMPVAGNFVLIRKDLPCSPCYKSKCKKHKCMESIKPQEVSEAIDRLLNPNNLMI
ncbi:MAG: lipopolysaccharide heptosyltransferase II, partial [Candidatus Omnitrophica bacterium]|nr:lipopolysaccharide heptosyltransferase II [Candidatus Omnitrophota bacterium]